MKGKLSGDVWASLKLEVIGQLVCCTPLGGTSHSHTALICSPVKDGLTATYREGEIIREKKIAFKRAGSRCLLYSSVDLLKKVRTTLLQTISQDVSGPRNVH